MRSTPAELERLVRYCHPAKLLATTRLPGLEALDEQVLARLYGATLDEYRARAQALSEQARSAAGELRAVPAIKRGIASLPLGPGDTLVALGDSHTDDLASWAEILRHLLALLRGDEEIRVLNAGLSGDTTTAVLARLSRIPPATLAVVLVGTNDARRHGREGAPMLVSHAETRRNLGAIDQALRRRIGRVVWITPPPVDETRITADPALTEADVTWRPADVERKAALVRSLDAAVVDLWPAFGADHLAADGLHPSAAGQRLIVHELLRAVG